MTTPTEALDTLTRHGYITDEWNRWQQGECDAYALALIDAYPHLHLTVIGDTELGGGDASEGWREVHYAAHDDTHAYDSAGAHRLPYYGIPETGHTCDYAETHHTPDTFGLKASPAALTAALNHARRHHITTLIENSRTKGAPC